MLEGVIVGQSIDLIGRDSGLDQRPQVIHELCVEAAGCPHSIALDFCELQFSKVLQHRFLEWSSDGFPKEFLASGIGVGFPTPRILTAIVEKIKFPKGSDAPLSLDDACQEGELKRRNRLSEATAPRLGWLFPWNRIAHDL